MCTRPMMFLVSVHTNNNWFWQGHWCCRSNNSIDILEACEVVRVLGVTIQNDLWWNSQVDNMLTSANRKLFALCCQKKFGLRDPELVFVNRGYVCPVLEYEVPVSHRLERMQKLAGKIIHPRSTQDIQKLSALFAYGLYQWDVFSCVFALLVHCWNPTSETGCPSSGNNSQVVRLGTQTNLPFKDFKLRDTGAFQSIFQIYFLVS